MDGQENTPQPGANQPPLRRFSRMLSNTTTAIDDAFQDVSTFLNVSEQVESVLEAEDGAKAQARPQEAPAAAEKADRRGAAAQDLGQRMMDPKKVMFRDKVTFFLGVVNVALIAYWIGRSPSTYYHYWTIKCCVLFPLRWWEYRAKGWHYLMLELCYAANFLGIAHVYWYPNSAFMRKLAFAYCAGPLMWSIMAMRNSLVFHDTDKITTLMMHASPAMTAWTLRWYPDPNQVQRLTPDTQAAMQHASWAEMTVMPTIFYMVWVLAYYLLTFVLLRNRIEGRGRLTMFSLMVPQDPEKAKRSPLARVVLSAGKAWQPFIYLGCHAVAATIALLPTKLFFDHYWLHTAALLAMLGLAIWNGASYYFIVFAKKYMARLEEQTGVRVNGDTKKVT